MSARIDSLIRLDLAALSIAALSLAWLTVRSICSAHLALTSSLTSATPWRAQAEGSSDGYKARCTLCAGDSLCAHDSCGGCRTAGAGRYCGPAACGDGTGAG